MIQLRKITEDNFDECVGLEPREDQKNYVASNMCSLAQAYVAVTNNEKPMPYAIYDNEIMVGFIMLLFSENEENNDENTYWVCRLMIDKKYQGKGFGKEAMKKAIELSRTFPCGNAKFITLSYEPENKVAKKLYESLEFVETGDIEDGELVAKLNL